MADGPGIPFGSAGADFPRDRRERLRRSRGRRFFRALLAGSFLLALALGVAARLAAVGLPRAWSDAIARALSTDDFAVELERVSFSLASMRLRIGEARLYAKGSLLPPIAEARGTAAVLRPRPARPSASPSAPPRSPPVRAARTRPCPTSSARSTPPVSPRSLSARTNRPISPSSSPSPPTAPSPKSVPVGNFRMRLRPHPKCAMRNAQCAMNPAPHRRARRARPNKKLRGLRELRVRIKTRDVRHGTRRSKKLRGLRELRVRFPQSPPRGIFPSTPRTSSA